MIYKLENPARTAALFADWEETIIWSCLQGIMGEIYVDDMDNPTAAKAVLGDFAFLAGASSYSVYDKGIEIEVDTKETHRRKGLTTACAAQLILLCLEKGLYPSWDAANLWSVALAEKLGYHRGEPYMVYEVEK